MSQPAPSSPFSSIVTEKWLQRGMFVTILLGCAITMAPEQVDPDLWGHVQYGSDVLASGLPETTTYSYTADGYRWINHENLSELIMATSAKWAGGPGLMLLRSFVALALVFMILRAGVLSGVRIVTLCLVSMIVAMNLTYHWSMRPQIFSYLLFAGLVLLQDWCFDGWQGKWNLPWLRNIFRAEQDQHLEYSTTRLRWLWLAPVIFAVWANTHGGFVAGFLIYSAILVLRGVEIFSTRGWQSLGILRRLTMMILAAGLATFLNPYGPRLHLWLFESLGQARPEIADWTPLTISNETFFPFVILSLLISVAIVGSRRSIDFTRLVIFLLVAWQAVAHHRHVPFLAILAGFWLPLHVESLLGRWSSKKENETVRVDVKGKGRRLFATVICLASLMLAVQLYQRVTDFSVQRSDYPIEALQYIADQNLQGKIVVHYDWAQYVIAAFGTRDEKAQGLRVGFDGRFRTCYPQEIVDMHFDFTLGTKPPVKRNRSPLSPAPDGSRILEYGSPDLVLVKNSEKHAVSTLQQQPQNWVLLYQDSLAQLWGRATKYDQPRSPNYLAIVERKLDPQQQSGSVLWPALPRYNRAIDELAAVDN